MRGAFILGKDGKVKVIVEAPGEVTALAALVIAGGGNRRLAFRAVAQGGKSVHIADDPGELERLAGGSPASLVFEDASPGQVSRTLWKLTITPGLEQRHRFYAALKGNT